MNKKEIDNEINKLFIEMIDKIKENGLQITISHRNPKTNKEVKFSKTIGDFRLKSLTLAKENPFNWSNEERMYFTTRFGRKTTPYFYLKKELLI